MRLQLFLEYLDPPGALAWASNLQDPPAAELVRKLPPEDQCLLVLFQRAFALTATHLASQILTAGHGAYGQRSAKSYIKAWRKHACPIATVMFGGGLYVLAYSPQTRHALTEQAWGYFKTALDLVSDDARDGLIYHHISDYDAKLPARLLAAHDQLPRLTFPDSKKKK